MSVQAKFLLLLVVVVGWGGFACIRTVGDEPMTEKGSVERLKIDTFVALLDRRPQKRAKSLAEISENWHEGDAPMLIEVARFMPDRRSRQAITDLLAQKTDERLGDDLNAWSRWTWNRKVALHPNYASFKSRIYRQIDPRFAEYFSDDFPADIRLDEIRWGGVKRDGIPPLNNPRTIPAKEADYLEDSDVIFGVKFGGVARAYPKRILAWHEMVKDTVGGRPINGVYCTLCGSMIVYDPEANGRHRELGTSGFLYRSNKLMYDRDTKSMWSTLDGVPVVGELVGKGVKLQPLYVVTTTWGQWKKDHPETDVLSLETGYRRDYGEGVAYRDYFATDDLMFEVPKTDARLKNKDEVLIVRPEGESPLAIWTLFLNEHPVHHETIAGTRFVILTDVTGANRVYESGDHVFESWSDASSIVDASGKIWTVNEDALVPAVGDEGQALRFQRLSAHRAFWFGWYSAFPETRLVK